MLDAEQQMHIANFTSFAEWIPLYDDQLGFVDLSSLCPMLLQQRVNVLGHHGGITGVVVSHALDDNRMILGER